MAESEPEILWPTLAEAIEKTGISERTLLRRADAGELEIRKRRVPGRKPVNIVNPAHLAELTESKPQIVNGAAGEHVATRAPAVNGANGGIAAILAALAESVTTDKSTAAERLALERRRERREELAAALWLTVDEAAEYTRLPRGAIEDGIKAQAFRTLKRKRYYISRESLEAYIG